MGEQLGEDPYTCEQVEQAFTLADRNDRKAVMKMKMNMKVSKEELNRMIKPIIVKLFIHRESIKKKAQPNMSSSKPLRKQGSNLDVEDISAAAQDWLCSWRGECLFSL